MLAKVKQIYVDVETNHPRYLGRFYAVLNTIVGSFGFYAAKKVYSIDGMNFGWYRGISHMFIGSLIMSYYNLQIFPFTREKMRVLFIRMLFAGFTVNLRFTAAKINSLQNFIIILRTESIQTLLISMIFLGEAFTIYKCIAALVAFLGTILVIKPGLFGLEDYADKENAMTTIGFLVAFAGGFVTA